ncbi:hypothetical protein ACIPY3_02695 [Paenarthrobacter sp. NPDC089714]|uniref:hypothetical protein n=1 Tax=Paenarthrobacter sp. NPDC089714 TaxID=3364377 RepID=UPI00381AE28F
MATGYTLVDAPNLATPQGTFPRRGGAALSGTAIVHTSEGDWRAGVSALTRLVQSRADYGCYHRACDWQDIETYYPWEWETWQDSETNNWAVGISAACKTTDWGNMPAEVEEGFYRNLARMAADFVQYMADNHDIVVPLRRISGAEARARVPGFCAHGDSGISRSDPGPKFDWARFFKYTDEILNGIEDDDMPDMNTIMNYPAFSPTKEFPKPPTNSEFSKAVYYALFNNAGNNESIIGGESLPSLENKNALKVLARVEKLEKNLPELIAAAVKEALKTQGVGN